MRILIFSLGPIFKDFVHGGSQKILREIAIHLGNKGHTIDIFCTQRKDNNKMFYLSNKVCVHPILKFKETFPDPYRTPPYNLSSVISILNKEIVKHDVFYIHDSDLPFFTDYNIPTVWSLRDFVYPESVIGGLNFSRDVMIINSKYTYLSYLSLIRGYRKNPEKRIVLIPNGININHFKYKNPEYLRKKIGLSENDLSIIYPHRPEESKGIFEVLKVLDILVNKRGLKNIKLLIPMYVDLNVSTQLDKIYKLIKKEAQRLNIFSNIIFHEWITYEKMPEYYSIGNLSLSIGNFVESFPNVSLESIACGTPSISARVAAHRYILPEDIEKKIDFGDTHGCADIAFDYLTMNDKKLKKLINIGRDYIISNFKFDKMLNNYEEIITNCVKNKKLSRINTSRKEKIYGIPSWCYLSERFGFYNDYNQGYIADKKFIELIKGKEKIQLNKDNHDIIIKHFEDGNLILI